MSLPPPMIGRCELFDEIACGGMATIHLGRMRGAGSFSRTVAIKRMHAQFSRDPEFVAMFLDEARIVARIRHPNVVTTIDLVEEEGVLYIIMEYVEGLSFAALLKSAGERNERVPAPVAVRIVTEALHGLHAAHEATDESGNPMRIVHRDVSPENILVGTDGYPRVLDFGVARAVGKQSTTQDGAVKGKIAYMAPEQILGNPLDQRTDVFSASAVLWQALTGHRLWKAENFVELAHKVLNARIEAPSKVAPDAPKKLDAIVLRGLEREVDKRWRTAGAMAEALEAAGGLATHREVGLWVRRLGTEPLRELAAKVAKLENKALTRRGTAKAGGGRPPLGRARAEAELVEAELVEAEQAPAHGGEPTGTSAVVSANGDALPAPVSASPKPSARARRGGVPRWALGAVAITLAVGAGLLGFALRGSSAAGLEAETAPTGMAPSSGTRTPGTTSRTDGTRSATASSPTSAATTVAGPPSATAPSATVPPAASPTSPAPTAPTPKPKPKPNVNPLYQMD